jgi:hypothetical protein
VAHVSHEPDRHRRIRPRLELHEDIDVDGRLSVLARKFPDDVALAVLVPGRDKGGIDLLAGVEVDEIHPPFAHDVPKEILDHPLMGEKESVTEVVLSHDLSSRILPQSIA